jgi:hypothetical protein
MSWVEFREGNYQEARDVLIEAKKLIVEEGYDFWQAKYARSLGEFSFHEGDKEGAAVLFAEAQEKSEATGLIPRRMDKMVPEEDSEGWRWFRGAQMEHTEIAGQVDGDESDGRLPVVW